MKVQAARMLFMGIIGGRELQGSWHRVSRNIEEYLHNLLANQAIISNVGALQEDLMSELVKCLTRIDERSESQSIDGE